jgi:hypothetical protein
MKWNYESIYELFLRLCRSVTVFASVVEKRREAEKLSHRHDVISIPECSPSTSLEIMKFPQILQILPYYYCLVP